MTTHEFEGHVFTSEDLEALHKALGAPPERDPLEPKPIDFAPRIELRPMSFSPVFPLGDEAIKELREKLVAKWFEEPVRCGYWWVVSAGGPSYPDWPQEDSHVVCKLSEGHGGRHEIDWDSVRTATVDEIAQSTESVRKAMKSVST